MAYTLDNLRTDIRGYTEVDNGATTPKVLTDSVLNTIIKNAENNIYRQIDTDQNVFYATSNAIVGNRYVTIPDDLRAIRYVQFKDTVGNQFYLEQRDTSFMAEYYSTPDTQAVDILTGMKNFGLLHLHQIKLMESQYLMTKNQKL